MRRGPRAALSLFGAYVGLLLVLLLLLLTTRPGALTSFDPTIVEQRILRTALLGLVLWFVIAIVVGVRLPSEERDGFWAPGLLYMIAAFLLFALLSVAALLL